MTYTEAQYPLPQSLKPSISEQKTGKNEWKAKVKEEKLEQAVAQGGKKKI